MSTPLEIPWQKLSDEALRGLLEEMVTRDGTDYGFQETDVEAKVGQVKKALVDGRAIVSFDPETESWTVLDKR